MEVHLMRANWSQKETELLKKLYPYKTAKELQEYFPQYTNNQINRKAKALGLKKMPEVAKQSRLQASLEARDDLWTDEEKQIIIKYYPTHGAKGVQEMLPKKRPLDHIKKIAYRLGLKRNKRQQIWELVEGKIVSDEYFAIEGVYKGR